MGVAAETGRLILPLSLPLFLSIGGGATLLRQGDGDPPPRFSPPDARVHGVLYRLDPAELSKLRRQEAGYELTQVEVRARDISSTHPQLFTPMSVAH